MHPINSINFGSGSHGIAVMFNNSKTTAGTFALGYVVKQLGTKRYAVTDFNNTATFVSTLASNPADVVALPVGKMTIVINGNEHVAKLSSKQAVTVEGNTYTWSIDTSVNGSGVIHSAAYVAGGGTP